MSLSCTSLNCPQFLGNTKVLKLKSLRNTRTSSQAHRDKVLKRQFRGLHNPINWCRLGPRLASPLAGGAEASTASQVRGLNFPHIVSNLRARPARFLYHACAVGRIDVAHSRRTRLRSYFHPAMPLNRCPTLQQLRPQGGQALPRLCVVRRVGICKVPRIPQHVVQANFSIDVHSLICKIIDVRIKSLKGEVCPHPRHVSTARVLGLRWIAGRVGHGLIRIFISGRCSMLPIFQE